MFMPVDIKSAVARNISELKKVISDKSSELDQLKKDLERHESVLELLSRDGGGHKISLRNGRRRRGSELNAVVSRLPETFTNKDFLKAAARARKSSVYLRQILSRWAKQGKIKRLQRGKYQKVKKANGKRLAA
jgi:nitrogen fixation protein